MMLQWESWVAASWVIIVLSPFWLGREQRWGGKLRGHRDMGFGWYFANSAKFYEVFWNGSESSQVPEAFISVSRIWIMACRDSVKSFDMADEQSSDTLIWSTQSNRVQWASFKCSQPDIPSACRLVFAGSSSENLPGHSELFIMCFQRVFVNNSTTERRPKMFFWYNWILKQCLSLKAIPLHFLLYLGFCWAGQTVSKCIFKLLSNFAQPLATYGRWQ